MKRITRKKYLEKVLLNKTEVLFSTVFTAILVGGHLLSTYKTLDIQYVGTGVLMAYFIAFLLIWLAIFYGLKASKKRFMNGVKKTVKPFEAISDKKLFLGVFSFIFASYIPVILLSFSVLTPDSWSSINQARGDVALSGAHPIIFTGFISIFIHIGLLFGSFELGVLLFSLVQSAILSLIFAVIIIWMRREGGSKVALTVTFIFYAILPINAFAGVIMWKDILFAAFGLLLLLMIRQLFIEKAEFFTRKNVLFFVLLAFLFCTWRNNGLFAYCLFVLFTLAVNHKILFSSKLLPLLATPLLLIGFYSIMSSTISAPTSKAETLSVPLQQIARTVKYHDGSLSNDDRKTIAEILPYTQLDELYNPELSDPVKSSLDVGELDEDKNKYMILWLKLFPEYKKTYFAAFLYNTYGYVYPFYDSPTKTDILLDNASHFNAPLGYIDSSYQSGRKQFLEIYRNVLYSISPVFYNIGFYFVIIFFCAYIAIIRRRKELVGVFVLLLAVFVTTILGPVNGEFRYLYLFVVSAPFMLFSVFSGDITKRTKKKHVKKMP